jgi:hypothetical protein
MMHQEDKTIDWILKLKSNVQAFLDRLKSHTKRGFFHYSLSGDLYSESENWGLGNTVFAVKVYYTIDALDSLAANELEDISSFIKGFQKDDGGIYDPVISRKVPLVKKLYAARNFDFSAIGGQNIKRAETRQSFSALKLLKSRPDLPYLQIPYTIDQADKYLARLDWSKPYDAGSHFSHLLFFWQTNLDMFGMQKESVADLINYATTWLNKLQSSEDGSWYRGRNVPLLQKINGAMKVITGLQAVGKTHFSYPEKLIDLCLSAASPVQACDALDVVYVIRYANELTEGKYRYDEITSFCHSWLQICKEHYYPEYGGFSFYKHRANQHYYGAKITKGFDEPDIHGTVLLLWGIALASQILGINKQIGFKEFIT